jgi:hypothetical protein
MVLQKREIKLVCPQLLIYAVALLERNASVCNDK